MFKSQTSVKTWPARSECETILKIITLTSNCCDHSNCDSDSKNEANSSGNGKWEGSLWLQGLRSGDERFNGRLGILHLTASGSVATDSKKREDKRTHKDASKSRGGGGGDMARQTPQNPESKDADTKT